MFAGLQRVDEGSVLRRERAKRMCCSVSIEEGNDGKCRGRLPSQWSVTLLPHSLAFFDRVTLIMELTCQMDTPRECPSQAREVVDHQYVVRLQYWICLTDVTTAIAAKAAAFVSRGSL